MQKGLGLSLLGLMALIACDDPHRVGVELGVGGSSGEVGGSGNVATGGTSATAQTGPDTGGGTLNAPPTNGGSSPDGGTTAGGAMQVGGMTGTTLADETCTWPKIQFEFTVEPPSDYCVSSYEEYAIQILAADGQSITSLGGTICPDTSCSACNPRICMVIAPEQHQVRSPTTRSWDGSYSSTNKCGVQNNVTCVVNRCVPAGHYIARYCVAPRGSLSTCDETDETKFLPATTCVDVPFDFPSSQVVRGRISSGVGGAGGSSGVGGTT